MMCTNQVAAVAETEAIDTPVEEEEAVEEEDALPEITVFAVFWLFPIYQLTYYSRLKQHHMIQDSQQQTKQDTAIQDIMNFTSKFTQFNFHVADH